MKYILGIFLLVLLLAALALYLLFMLNARSLVPCGDIAQTNGTEMSITRIYTSDLSANETLFEIVNTMNDDEEGRITAEALTEILANYQDIIYAPVFMMNLEQEDANTFVLTGSVYNGLDDDGEPTTADFKFKNLMLTAGVNEGKILAAQNVYDDQKDDEDGDDEDPEFLERRNVIDPIIVSDGAGAAFSFKDCDSFRLVFKNTSPVNPASITLAYTYDVVAENPLNFTSFKDGLLGVVITAAYDDMGRLVPRITVDRKNIIIVDEE